MTQSLKYPLFITQADFHIQTMIINGLSHFFPQLLVIGEESVDYKGTISIDYRKLTLDFIPS
jgi:3'-phosphoadenosine 5'-phosphosulfate (PAPS) 3'-phosphatase